MAGISEEEIIQYKKDLETYPAKKKKMLIMALIAFGVAFIFLVIFIVFTIIENSQGGASVMWFISFILWPLFTAIGVALLIFRYEIYTLKAANRQRLINKAESIKREEEHPHSKDDKIGF